MIILMIMMIITILITIIYNTNDNTNNKHNDDNNNDNNVSNNNDSNNDICIRTRFSDVHMSRFEFGADVVIQVLFYRLSFIILQIIRKECN